MSADPRVLESRLLDIIKALKDQSICVDDPVSMKSVEAAYEKMFSESLQKNNSCLEEVFQQMDPNLFEVIADGYGELSIVVKKKKKNRVVEVEGNGEDLKKKNRIGEVAQLRGGGSDEDFWNHLQALSKSEDDKDDADASVVEIPVQTHPILERSSETKKWPQDLDVVVHEITSPTDFWVSLRETFKDLERLMDAMNKKERERERVTEAKIGECYMCRYDGEWHRVRVREKPIGGKVDVFYIDYGTRVEGLDVSELRVLPPEFRQLPAQAFHAALSGIEPKDGGGWWSDEARYRFLDLNRESMEVEEDKGEIGWLRGRIVGLDENADGSLHLQLDLIDTLTCGQGEQGRSLTNVLVKEKYAEYTKEKKGETDRAKASTISPHYFWQKAVSELAEEQDKLLKTMTRLNRTYLREQVINDQKTIRKYLSAVSTQK